MANKGDGGGDNVIRQQPSIENVNLNIEGNARNVGDRQALTPAAMMSNLAELDHFNKTFDPKNFSAEQLTAMLAANETGITNTKQFMNKTALDLGKAANVADAERSGIIQPMIIHQDV